MAKEKRDAVKIKRLKNQYKKLEGNPERQKNILLRIKTIENTKVGIKKRRF